MPERYAGRGFRRAVDAALPETLTRLAPLLDMDAPDLEKGMEDLAVWCHADPVRTVSLIFASLTTMSQYEVTPDVLRRWAASRKTANIREYKNPTVDSRVNQ